MNKRLALFISASLLLASCGGKEPVAPSSSIPASSEVSSVAPSSSEKTPVSSSESIISSSSSKEVIKVSSITIENAPSVMTVGDNVRLTINVLPENADDTKVNLTSSDPTVVDVSRTTITAYGPGKATITATANDGSGTKAEFEVTVKAKVTAPLDWESARTLIVEGAKKMSKTSAVKYDYLNTSYKDTGEISSTTSEERNYVYAKDGTVSYTGIYTYNTPALDDPQETATAGYRGVVDGAYKTVDHTKSTYDYVNKSEALTASFTEENAAQKASEITEIAAFLDYIDTPSKWSGTKTYEGKVEDDLIKISYGHTEESYNYSYSGSLSATITPDGELVKLVLSDDAYYNPDFTNIRYNYTYSIEVASEAKVDKGEVEYSDFFLSENYTNIIRSYGSKQDNVVYVGNYLQFEGRDTTKPFAIDYLEEDFEIISSSDESIIGKKSADAKVYYVLGEGKSTITIKRKSTGETREIEVTALRPAPTSFDTVKSSEGISMNVGTITTFTATMKPVEAKQEFLLRSSDESVMRVYQDGGVWYGEALKAGDVTITFYSEIATVPEKTIDIKVNEAPAEAPKYVGTWINGSNTLVLEANGNGSWNGTPLMFSYDASTKKGTIAPFGAFDDGGYFTFNETADTVYIDISDEYHEFAFWSGNMTRKAEQAAKSYVGTWRAGSNILVLEANGNGVWNGLLLTYTYNEATKKGTIPPFDAFDDGGYFTYNEKDDTVYIDISDEYHEFAFWSGTMYRE